MTSSQTDPAVLESGQIVLGQTCTGSSRWELRICGAAVSSAVDAGIVVPNARRASIAISEWSPQHDRHAATVLKLLLAHLFSHDKAHQVQLPALDVEQCLLDAALRCGFLEEGRARHVSILDGYWRDEVCMSIFEEQWRCGPPAEPRPFVPRDPTRVPDDLPPIPEVAPEDFAILQGERILMRRKRPDDRDLFFSWRCRSEWWKGWMPEDPDGFAPPSREAFEKEWRGTASPNEWVVESNSGKPVGVCFYSGLDRTNRSAEADILLYDSDVWGQGIGTDAFRVLLRHLFEDLHLHRVRSGTWSGNIGSVRVQLKSGFRIEVESKDSYFVDGKWYGGIGTGILEDEWRKEFGANYAMQATPDAAPDG